MLYEINTDSLCSCVRLWFKTYKCDTADYFLYDFIHTTNNIFIIYFVIVITDIRTYITLLYIHFRASSRVVIWAWVYTVWRILAAPKMKHFRSVPELVALSMSVRVSVIVIVSVCDSVRNSVSASVSASISDNNNVIEMSYVSGSYILFYLFTFQINIIRLIFHHFTFSLFHVSTISLSPSSIFRHFHNFRFFVHFVRT